MSIFDNVDDIYSLIAEIIELKNAVRCPICLDIISNPVQISCHHLFCSDCINAFLNVKSTKISCPVCRKSIKRQRQEPSDSFKQLIEFVTNVNKKLLHQFGCDLSALGSLNKMDHALKKNKREMKQTARECLKKFTKTPSKQSSSNKTGKKDAFDVLMESCAPNIRVKRQTIVKTYSRKKEKQENNCELGQKLINFEDENYRLKIINWLCDNRNRFDRLTQTQSIIDDDSCSSISSLDLPSISQEKKPISCLSKRKAVTMKRAKSLDIKVQQGSALKSKRYSSFSGESQKELENVNIEEIDSDKDILNEEQINMIQMLEEKCLNSIEVMLQDKENNNSEKGKTKRKRRHKTHEETNQTKGVDPGWNRIQKMNKSLNKNNREMKKLPVSLTSTAKLDKRCNSSLVQTKDIGQHKKSNVKPVVLLNRLSSEYELWKESKPEENNKSYNLREVESYIENNINKYENPEKSNSNLSPKVSNKNAISALVSDQTKLRLDEINEHHQVIEKSYETACNSLSEDDDWNFICRTSQSACNKTQIPHSGSIFSQSKSIAEDPDDIFSLPTQKIILDSKLDKVEKDLRGLFSSPETIEKQTLSVDKDIVSHIHEISIVLNQLENSITSFTKCLKNNIDVDIAKFSIDKLKSLLNNLKNNGNIPHVLQEDTKNISQYVSLDTRSIAIQTNDYTSSGFKISSTADFKTLEKCNVQIQTDEITDKEYLQKLSKMLQNPNHSYLQTNSIAIQTEKPKAETQKQSVGVQIEMLTNQEPVYIASDTSVSSRTPSDILVNNDEIASYCRNRFQFAESLNCVNFDTQAALSAIKQKEHTTTEVNSVKCSTQAPKSIRKKLSYEINEIVDNEVNICCSDSDVEIVENEDTLVSKENEVDVETALKLQENVVKCSEPHSTISFSLTQKDNAMNNSMINRFKRVRALMEDCDDGVIKKLKKQENPYLMPQLSVEFISQVPENVHEESKGAMMQNDTMQSIQISQSLDYDEYLDKIMEKYDENNIKTSTPKKELSSKSRQTKSQYLINKCNALIQEAAVSPPASPPKKKLCKEYDITTQDLEEFKLPFNEIITEPVNVQQTSPKKTENHTQSIFYTNTQNVKGTILDEMPFSNMESLAEEFSKELQPKSPKSVSCNKSISDIKVLQNVLLQKQDVGNKTPELQYNLEDEWQKMEECAARGSQQSEEVFSDSDIDVVETTPQKESRNDKLFLSQSLQNRHSANVTIPIQLPPPEDSADVIFATNAATYLNKTFDPPTEFQDVNIDVPVSGNHTNLLATYNFDTILPIIDIEKVEDSDLDETLTDVKINKDKIVSEKQRNAAHFDDLRFMKDNTETTKNTNMIDQKYVTTQMLQNIHTKQVVNNISNVSAKQRDFKDLNPIEIALKSNYTPLEIVPIKLQSKQVFNLSNLTPKKQESILRYVNSQTKSNEKIVKNSILSVKTQEPRIACTRLNKDQFIAVSALTNRKLATYSNSFDSSVTHMIVSVNDKNCIQDHTMKFVSAVAAGIWVVSFRWIQECLIQNKIVQEEPYEALDVSGVPGPKIARLKMKPPLLKDFLIYVAASSLSVNKSDVENVIHMLGGKTASTLEALAGKLGIRLIISEAKVTQEFGMYETWLETLKVATVDIEWLSRSVGQYQLLSLKPFALCSDDNFVDLGYPEELLVDTPFSFSQSIYNS